MSAVSVSQSQQSRHNKNCVKGTFKKNVDQGLFLNLESLRRLFIQEDYCLEINVPTILVMDIFSLLNIPNGNEKKSPSQKVRILKVFYTATYCSMYINVKIALTCFYIAFFKEKSSSIFTLVIKSANGIFLSKWIYSLIRI